MNTFFGVDQNTQIFSYVENIFTETPNQKFDVSVNIFSTYEEMEPIRFGSKIERLVLLEKTRNQIFSESIESRNFKKIL